MTDVREIPGFEGRYWVSENGEVFNSKRRMKTYLIWNGYERVDLGKKKMLVHRLVAMAFLPNPESLGFVNHLDGNKAHNHWRNLEWCTKSQNNAHAFRIGLCIAKVGVDHPMAKLNLDQVAEIRKLRQTQTLKSIADRFSVSVSLIHKIVNQELWASVK